MSKFDTFAQALASDRELLLYAMTPPRVTTSAERAQEIADSMLRRLEGVNPDALVLYDLDDESDRVDEERPFPYLETRDPAEFLAGPLAGWDGHSVIYRCVGKYSEDELTQFLTSRAESDACVFVGASSSGKVVKTRLSRGMELHEQVRPQLPLGSVAIPERHVGGGKEHDRLLRKQSEGSSFFITQVVYDVGRAKDLISDYVYACQDAGVAPARLIFTLSLCGSEKTLDFLEWLGVDVPRWVGNELRHSRDTLDSSYELCLSVARDLAHFCRYLGLPFGFNVESVSTRKVELEATADLAREVNALLERDPECHGRDDEVTSAFLDEK